MAQLVDFGGEVNSNLVAGLGTNQAVFTMPGNLGVKVQSVVATINNGTGNDVTATVVVKDSAGQVIATKRQADVIPAGDVGTATWALRLDDSDGTGIRFRRVNTGSWLIVNATGLYPGVFQVGLQSAVWSFAVNGIDTGIGATDTLILSSEQFLQISAGNNITINTDTDVFVGADTWTATIGDAVSFIAGNEVIIGTSGAGPVQLYCDNNSVICTDAGVTVVLEAGDALTVKDHLGNPIFRVDEDGDLHGLTGKSLTFDL